MSRKLTLDINFIDTPRDGDVFGYQISNNGVPLSFNGFDGWDKTFKGSTDYTTANGRIMSLNANLNPNTTDNTDIGSGFNGIVNAIKKQSDGKYICVGGFTSYQGITLSSRKICRLNTDFTLDTSFTPPDFPSDISALEIDSSDRIYIGGFDTIGGKGRLCRLGSNGTQDLAYPVGTGFDRPVLGIKLQPDGKLIVVGVMSLWNGSTPCKGIIRLTTTGIKDASFNGVTQGFILNNSFPRTVDLLANGSIVVGGDFYSYNNISCGNLVVLKSSGAFYTGITDVDNSPSGTFGDNVLKVLVDNLDRIYVTGKFERYGGAITCNKIIRMKQNSSLLWVPDLDFAVIADGLDNGTSTTVTGGYDMLFNDDGNLVVVGNFGTVQGTSAQNIAVLDPDGVLSPNGEDTGGVFNSTGFPPIIKTISNLGDRFIIGGSFNTYSNVGIPAVSSQFVIPIAEELTVNFGDGFYNGTVDNYTPTSIAVRNNKFVVTGNFISYDTNGANKVVRINPDGSYDSTFDSSVGVTSSLLSNALEYTAIDKDDKVYIVGDIVSYDGNTTTNVTRINSDGSFDNTFDTGSGFNTAAVVSILPDDVNGGALFLGGFTQYNGATAGYISKILDDGALDPTFNVGTGFNGPTLSIIDTGNGYVIAGAFTQFNGVSQNRLVKLNYDGSKDTSFIANASDAINGLVKQSDGKIICLFNGTYNGVTIAGNMFRIKTDGSYDPTFDSTSYIAGGSGAPRNLIEVDSQDRIYVFSFNDLTVIRFTKDGVLDTTFVVTELAGINAQTNYLKSMKMYFNNLVVVGNIEVNSTPQGIAMLGEDGSVVTTDVDNYQTIINTYDNLITFNSGYGIQYQLLPDKVRMLYTFDNNEIVINNVYETTDYVEITFTNESLTLPELVDEIVVRSPYLVESTDPSFDSVNYKVKIFEGSIFAGASGPVSYDITKGKLFAGQSQIYINLNNLIRENLEANINTFIDDQFFDSQPLPSNMSKWVWVDEIFYSAGVTGDAGVRYLYALDGFLFNSEEQGVPNVLITGDKRYVHRNQPQRIYFQSNFLTNIEVRDQYGSFYNPTWDSTDILGDNTKYVQSLQIDTYFRGPQGSRPPGPIDYIDYTFTYSNADPVTVRFEIYEDCKYELLNIVYKNKWGVLESIPFSAKAMSSLETTGTDFERSILDYNGNYDITRHTTKQFNVSGNDSMTINTNWMPEYMNEAFKELMLSEEVWLVRSETDITPIIKEDSKIDFKTQLNDKLIQYTMKIKFSHSTIKNIL